MTSEVRKEFTNAVLGQSLMGVKNHWQQQIFAGRAAPPPVKETEAEVVAFVAATPGAIGYVSTSASLSSGVKVITTSE